MGNGSFKYLNIIKESIASLLYPSKNQCVICGTYTEKGICMNCFSKINWCKGNFYIEEEKFKVCCYSIAYYSSIIMEMILNLKYKKDFRSGEILASYMVEKIMEENISCDLITYIPSDKKTLKRRGFNQSEFLAKKIGSTLELPVKGVLIKAKSTKEQKSLDRENRWINLKESFKLDNKNEIVNKKIILIDDIVTTGATVYFASKELSNVNIKELNVLTVAKIVV